ncbi:MAG: histidine kinase [Methylibium sp. NZG]|nr:MAG: histidine kinase [Methylibium sp. NZG]
MTEASILNQVTLGYSPLIDRNHAVTATRLTVFPMQRNAVLDAGLLLDAVADVWPANGPRVSLNVVSESLLSDLIKARPSTNVMVEIPSFMASDPANLSAIKAVHANGNALLLKGRPASELPREVLPCFKYSIIDIADDRRAKFGATAAPPGVTRSIQYVQSGIHNVADMEESFARGAAAVLGWPIDDPITPETATGSMKAQTDLSVIMQLIQQVDAEEAVEKMENTLKRDPALAFKLIKLINSAAFGMTVEISSLRHAIMLLGFKRFKRWLAVLLATASKDASLKPMMFAAVRRGMLMEELARGSGDDEMRGEMFICGVFSLLDRMFRQTFAQLLSAIPVPERVFEALVHERGPFQPYLALVNALEAGSPFDLKASAETVMMGVQEINRALLRALNAASEID